MQNRATCAAPLQEFGFFSGLLMAEPVSNRRDQQFVISYLSLGWDLQGAVVSVAGNDK
jgi:hypothetical protein